MLEQSCCAWVSFRAASQLGLLLARGPKGHINTRMLETMISRMSLVLGLSTRM